MAVLLHAGQVAEVTHWTQTLQLLRHVALFPATITPTHLHQDKERHEHIQHTLRDFVWFSVQCSGTPVYSPHSRVQCTETCSGVYRTPLACLRSGCAASSVRCRSSRCRDARHAPCYERSGHIRKPACSLEHTAGCVLTQHHKHTHIEDFTSVLTHWVDFGV